MSWWSVPPIATLRTWQPRQIANRGIAELERRSGQREIALVGGHRHALVAAMVGLPVLGGVDVITSDHDEALEPLEHAHGILGVVVRQQDRQPAGRR